VLTHAINLIRFERLEPMLTEEVLDRAFESCFLQDQEPELAPAVPIATEETQGSILYKVKGR
jgi:hypothetical protein